MNWLKVNLNVTVRSILKYFNSYGIFFMLVTLRKINFLIDITNQWTLYKAMWHIEISICYYLVFTIHYLKEKKKGQFLDFKKKQKSLKRQ